LLGKYQAVTNTLAYSTTVFDKKLYCIDPWKTKKIPSDPQEGQEQRQRQKEGEKAK
jgi:hypothetical protein